MQFEYLDSRGAVLDILTETEFEDQIRQACDCSDVSEVTVEAITPGLSGAAVFLIRRLGQNGRLVPLVAKACKDEKLLIAERDNFRNLIQERLPEAVSLLRASPRLLIFAFAGHLGNRKPVTLRSGYAPSSPTALAVLMRRIVGSLTAIQTVSPDTVSCVRRMPLTNRLDDNSLKPLLPPDVIARLRAAWRGTLLEADAIPAIRSTAHGDLNAGNILFEPGTEPSEPVFIDFASMRRSKDNIAYQAEGYHLPFWDYAKLERDIQTRLFLKEALGSSIRKDEIIAAIRGLDGMDGPLTASAPTEKLWKTVSSLREAVQERHSPEDLKAYRVVVAYAMLSVLFREQPDADLPEGIQRLVAAEASIAMLSDRLPRAGAPSVGQSTVPSLESMETYLFVGRDQDVDALRKKLTAEKTPNTDRTIVVQGISGVGKSTLVRVLARDTYLRNHYPDPVLWASLGPSPAIRESLHHWHKELTGRDLPECELADAERMVARELENQRRLLIVDDVWRSEDLDLIPPGGAGCARVVTTRHADLARLLGIPTRHEYHLGMLSAENGFRLLDELAHDAIQGFEPEAKDLVAALEGLPLALQVAGRLLRAEHGSRYNVMQLLQDLRDGKALLDKECPENMRDLVSQTLPTVAVVLRKSTDRLDALTQERFAWLGHVAPKPAVFELDFLQQQWIETDHGSVRATVRILIDRGLIEPVGDGEYWMHGLFVALADSLCAR